MVLPSQAAALAAAVKLEREAGTGNSGYGGGGSGGGRGGGPVDGRVGGDGGLIAQKIARQMAERKKQEGEIKVGGEGCVCLCACM